MDNFRVNSPVVGSAITFDKPVEFKSSLPPATKAPVADLHHTLGKSQDIADIVVSVVPAPSANQNKDIGALKQFVSGRLVNLSPDFDTERQIELTSKSKAWQTDFTTSPVINHGIAAFPTKKGTALVIAGHSSNYYILIDALDRNWDSNQAVWQKIINSLKVDQQ
jgi:hypothetical protein